MRFALYVRLGRSVRLRRIRKLHQRQSMKCTTRSDEPPIKAACTSGPKVTPALGGRSPADQISKAGPPETAVGPLSVSGLPRNPSAASGASMSCRYGDFAYESFRTPIEAHTAFRLPNHVLHYTRAESASRGGSGRRTTRFGPAKHNCAVDRA